MGCCGRSAEFKFDIEFLAFFFFPSPSAASESYVRPIGSSILNAQVPASSIQLCYGPGNIVKSKH